MKPLNYFADQLTDINMLVELTESLRRRDEYFQKLEQKYTEAILKAQHTLDSEDLMILNNYIAAWNQQLVA